MNKQRKALYKQIFSAVKDSPIRSIKHEGNTFHFKCDYMLSYGECHYSRVFSRLIYLKECLGIINPGDVLLETTSGSGGRAAASIATALGYRIKIAMPAGGEKAREEAIIKAGGEIFLTKAEDYVNAFPEFITKMMERNPETIYLNHVMGDIFGRGTGINGVVINSFRPFVDEVVEAGVVPDVVICPLGNGTTALPIAEGFKTFFRKVKVIGFESVASALAYRKKYGEEKFLDVFDCDVMSIGRHDLPGTTPPSVVFPIPALDASIPLFEEVWMVTSDHVDNLFIESVGFKPADRSEWVAKYDDFYHDDMEEFGRTGKAGFAVAELYARKNKMHGKHFLIPVFDAIWHYD